MNSVLMKRLILILEFTGNHLLPCTSFTDWVHLFAGNLCMITGGHNLGRVGIVTHRERHPGGFDIVHIKDSMGHSFATRFVYLDVFCCD